MVRASDSMGSTFDGAFGNAQHINDMALAINTAPSALDARICFMLMPLCRTNTLADSNRFMET